MTPQKDPKIITEQLCQFVRENFAAEGVVCNEQSPLGEVGVDSFALVELLLFCERAFGVRVPESSMTRSNLASVAALAKCIAEVARGSQP
jgi:acyl carrier protein